MADGFRARDAFGAGQVAVAGRPALRQAMDAIRTIRVMPIYGWGWVIAGARRFDVPAPFTVRIEQAAETDWSGVVLDSGHEFEGQWVELSQRHLPWDGDVNIVVRPRASAGPASCGFSTLAGFSSTEGA